MEQSTCTEKTEEHLRFRRIRNPRLSLLSTQSQHGHQTSFQKANIRIKRHGIFIPEKKCIYYLYKYEFIFNLCNHFYYSKYTYRAFRRHKTSIHMYKHTLGTTCVSITQNTLLLIYVVHMLVLFFIFKRTKQSWQDGSGG